MLKKEITYTDFNGNKRTEDFYFNLTKSELAQMELSTAGGMQQRLNRIIRSSDNQLIMKEFNNFLKASYGVRSDDGRKFEKSDELWRDFEQSAAYDTFFMDLVTNNGEDMADFLNQLMPEDLREQVARERAAEEANRPEQISDPPVNRPQPQDHLPSRREMRESN